MTVSSPVQEQSGVAMVDPGADAAPVQEDFTHLPDLASRSLGGSVVYANDELFAERENLIRPEAQSYWTYTFGHEGDQECGLDGGAADDVLAGRPVQDLDALPGAVRSLLRGAAR